MARWKNFSAVDAKEAISWYSNTCRCRWSAAVPAGLSGWSVLWPNLSRTFFFKMSILLSTTLRGWIESDTFNANNAFGFWSMKAPLIIWLKETVEISNPAKCVSIMEVPPLLGEKTRFSIHTYSRGTAYLAS
jgi:hypothetical protein